MFVNTLRSEWTKLATTKAFWWTSGLFLFFAIGAAAFFGAVSDYPAPNSPEAGGYGALAMNPADDFVFGVTALVPGVCFMILCIQAIMVVTAEYRNGYQSVTFMATPQRPLVALAKLTVYAIIAVILTVLCLVACYGIASSLATIDPVWNYNVWTDPLAIRRLWAFPLMAVFLVALSQGISWMVRQAAGAIAIVILWNMALEDILSVLPRIGTYIERFAPFNNMKHFLFNTPIEAAPWGVTGSGIYFAVWAIAFFIGGVFLLNRRDA